jgi:ABC-type transport system involved in multi-copper enzyme maturation permease subunit
VTIVLRYSMREAVRRRVFLVVLVLSVAFLVMFALGVDRAFDATGNFSDTARDAGVDSDTVAGSIMLGLSMFATLFLGVVLGSFLTLGAIRGDAERGLLQPLVVRPIGRTTLLLGRYAGAAATAGLYVLCMFFAAVAITNAIGGWLPDRLVTPALELAGAAGIVVALAVLGSVVLSANANGIAVFMLFGAGLVGGLLGQIGRALDSVTLEHVATGVSWALPFEALYQDALASITADSGGATRFVINLGPFGGAHAAGTGLWVWSAAYTALVGLVALWLFARKDL